MKSSPIPETLLTARTRQAFDLAFELHHAQRRKGSETPYLAHLMSVAALVLEDGGDEDQAIAALLHDAVEDQGGLPVLERIRQLFGERVAWTVLGCSDATGIPKPPWEKRKQVYLEHLNAANPDILQVSLADKLHNVRTILGDLRTLGPELWQRFNGGRDGSLWYYRALADFFLSHSTSPMAVELNRVVGELEALARTQTDCA